jgi:hypothetical protein
MFHIKVRTLRVCATALALACVVTTATAGAATLTTQAHASAHERSALAYPEAMAGAYEAASVRAKPDLQCKLHTPGTPATQGIPVDTGGDGYARFYAVRAGHGAARATLVLNCRNASGGASAYPVDLASAATFAPRPLDLAAQPGKDRPRLAGDAMQFTQAQLIQDGYGLRPSPVSSPGAYRRWLAAARVNGRMLDSRQPAGTSHSAWSQAAPAWSGTVLTGEPTYAAVEGEFNVPTAIPAGDGTTTTEVAIWNGLGGFGTGSGLIQSGVNLYTNSTAAAYGSWREYCCGDPYSNGYGGAFTPRPGDEIYAENWYCDAQGDIDAEGGYGCSYLVDLNTDAVLNCTSPTGSPCWSVPATAGMTFGDAADFIIENQSPQVSSTSTAFTDFSPAVTMTGTAYSTATGSFSQTIGNDPDLNVLTDFTNTTSHIVVGTTSTAATVFTMEGTQPSYPLYCQGPLKASTAQVPTPTLTFTWSNHGAGTKAPGPGKCAWADRGPEGSEIHPGNTGVIYGYLNQAARLRAGQYSELGVYSDANFGNDLNVTQIVGLVSPPFSSSPVLP